tara:strand:- start:1285 stop:1680 length:396 start_codon:yes stop_codon:yes gene_type:complete
MLINTFIGSKASGQSCALSSIRAASAEELGSPLPPPPQSGASSGGSARLHRALLMRSGDIKLDVRPRAALLTDVGDPSDPALSRRSRSIPPADRPPPPPPRAQLADVASPPVPPQSAPRRRRPALGTRPRS